jgi:hypothetical protein
LWKNILEISVFSINSGKLVQNSTFDLEFLEKRLEILQNWLEILFLFRNSEYMLEILDLVYKL